MFCYKCGASVDKNDKYCFNCGAENINYNPDPPKPPEPPKIPEQPKQPEAPKPDNPKKTKKKKSTPVIIAIVSIFVVALIVGVSCLIYFTSDTYKVSQAQKLVISQNYDEAQAILNVLSTPKSEVLNNYIQLENLKKTFLDSFNADKIISSTDNKAYKNMYAFINEVNDFSSKNDVTLLPDELKSNYDYYVKIGDGISKSGISKELFSNAQFVFMNNVIRNHQETFMPYRLNDNITASKEALASISDKMSKVPDMRTGNGSYLDLSQGKMSSFNSLLETFAASCEKEIAASEKIVSAYLKKYGQYESAYITEKDPYYTAKVMDGLNKITRVEDCSKNAEILFNTFHVALMAQYLSE